MTHHSILFPDDATDAQQPAPDFFVDLNLDQIIDTITAGYDEYTLRPFFYRPLRTVDAVVHRHEVAQDLEDPGLFERIGAFAHELRSMRSDLVLSAKMRDPYQGQRWFLEAARTYGEAINRLADDLKRADLTSRGLRSFRDHLSAYVSSESFTALLADTHDLLEDLAQVRYSLQIKGNRIRVSIFAAEVDYSSEVLASFEKFQQGTAVRRRASPQSSQELNHVEATILNLVVKLYPDTFGSLATFCETHRGYLDPVITRFDREVQFYLSSLQYLAPLRAAGLPFCYPVVSDTSKQVDATQSFDLALANKMTLDGAAIVRNDFFLRGEERILVVSGPNQGGKTTFARMFGQLHYLASLGLPVPGTQAHLFLFDEMFTHFERQEDLTNLTGKLEDDLVRIHDVLERATTSSVIVLNEIFTSTTLEDALFLGTKVLERIIALDALCVCVTFIDEFASMGPSTVSMMSTVLPADATQRTFAIVRKPADGLAFAAAVAEKYGLSYESLKKRLTS